MPPVRPVATPFDRPIRLAVLISGGGTTLQNLLARIAEGELHAEVAIVIASRASCGGVAKAQSAGLSCEVVPRKQFDTIDEFSRRIFGLCRDANVDLVVLAGFLSLFQVPEDFTLRVMNIHPALIPSFCGTGYYGHHVHRAAIERGVKVSGCTVHFADDEYDHGPIILQKCVPVLDDDDPETLASRVFKAECEAYPEAIRLFAAGRIELNDGRVRILDCPLD